MNNPAQSPTPEQVLTAAFDSGLTHPGPPGQNKPVHLAFATLRMPGVTDEQLAHWCAQLGLRAAKPAALAAQAVIAALTASGYVIVPAKTGNAPQGKPGASNARSR